MQLDPNDLDDIVCTCGSGFWIEARTAKYVPAVLSPDGKPSIAPIPQLICMGCGKLIEDALALKEQADDQKSGLIL